MSTTEILEQFSKLPVGKKKSVSDYIAFLITQFEEENKNKPLHHRDIFDRMIIAQSITEDLTILLKVKNFSLYPIKLLW